MKQLFKSKITKLMVTGLTMTVLATGGSYAWWTASTTDYQTIQMGSLNIDSQFEKIDPIDNYEPGLTAEVNGKITNTGKIDTIIKIESDSKVKLTSQSKFAPDNDGVVSLNVDPTSGLYDDTEGVYWFTNTDNNNERYILLATGAKVSVTNEAEFSGDKITNKYIDSQIQIGSKVKATQVLDGAIEKELGIDPAKLVGLSDAKFKARTVSPAKNTRADQKLNELLNRGK